MKTLLKSDYRFISGAKAIGYRMGPIGMAIGAGVAAANYAYSQHKSGKPITGKDLIQEAAIGAINTTPLRFLNSKLGNNLTKGIAHKIKKYRH